MHAISCIRIFRAFLRLVFLLHLSFSIYVFSFHVCWNGFDFISGPLFSFSSTFFHLIPIFCKWLTFEIISPLYLKNNIEQQGNRKLLFTFVCCAEFLFSFCKCFIFCLFFSELASNWISQVQSTKIHYYFDASKLFSFRNWKSMLEILHGISHVYPV